jgi:pimeloyl-ACP methyl ester carboxylesterase
MRVSSGTAQIAVDVVGPTGAESADRDVLFFHAGVNDRRSWHHVVDRLSPRHRCVTFDARGFGETTYDVEDGWSIPADAAAVADEVGIERAVLVACSMGGGAALDFALEHPDRVEALVLIGTAVGGAPYPEVSAEPIASMERQIEAAEEAGDLDELNRLETWLWLDGPDAPGRVQGAARDLFMEMNAHALRQPDPGERARRDDTWERLGEIAAPVLVLVGTLDVPDLKDVCAQLPERLPDAGLVWLDGVAHVPHLEGHRETLELVEDFVDGRLPGA